MFSRYPPLSLHNIFPILQPGPLFSRFYNGFSCPLPAVNLDHGPWRPTRANLIPFPHFTTARPAGFLVGPWVHQALLHLLFLKYFSNDLWRVLLLLLILIFSTCYSEQQWSHRFYFDSFCQAGTLPPTTHTPSDFLYPLEV